MYQRTTPRPAANTPTAPPAVEPAATTEAPSVAPTKAPKEDKDKEKVVETPSPTNVDVTMEEELETETPTTTSATTGPFVFEDVEETAEQDATESLGEIVMSFSLYSPGVETADLDLEVLNQAVGVSIDIMLCDNASLSGLEAQHCAIREDLILQDAEVPATKQAAAVEGQTRPIMALAAKMAKDSTGIVQRNSFSWTTWTVQFYLLEEGTLLREYVAAEGADSVALTDEEYLAKGLEALQQIMEEELARVIQEGILQQDLTVYMNQEFHASVIGEEMKSFAPVVPSPVKETPKPTEAPSVEEEEEGSMMIVFFFAGLGVAGCVIVTLLYCSCRRRKRNARAGKDEEEDEEQAVPADDYLSKTSNNSSDKNEKTFISEEAEEPVKEEPPKKEKKEARENESEAQETRSHRSGSQKSGNDLESHFQAQSVAQSSMYTGSAISAITGLSDMENSETWSVGSLSIDLAEWGES